MSEYFPENSWYDGEAARNVELTWSVRSDPDRFDRDVIEVVRDLAVHDPLLNPQRVVDLVERRLERTQLPDNAERLRTRVRSAYQHVRNDLYKEIQIASRQGGGPAGADGPDAGQDAIVKLYERKGGRRPENPTTYANRVARNTAIDSIRARNRRREQVLDLERPRGHGSRSGAFADPGEVEDGNDASVASILDRLLGRSAATEVVEALARVAETHVDEVMTTGSVPRHEATANRIEAIARTFVDFVRLTGVGASEAVGVDRVKSWVRTAGSFVFGAEKGTLRASLAPEVDDKLRSSAALKVYDHNADRIVARTLELLALDDALSDLRTPLGTLLDQEVVRRAEEKAADAMRKRTTRAMARQDGVHLPDDDDRPDEETI